MKQKPGNKNSDTASPDSEEAIEKNTKKSSNEEFFDDLNRSKKEIEAKSFLKHLQSKLTDGSLNLFESGINGLLTEYKEFSEEKEKSFSKYVAFETVAANAVDTVEYYILLIFSCLIATMGLYQNSSAVIIGAMIVAPLMGPIFGLSAGVLWGSATTIIEAFTTLAKGVVLVILITWALTAAIPFITVSEEILARTRPGLGDIIIAIASGIIGSYAYVNKRVSSSIPGVAISVALMPPLCTIGIGLGLQNWAIANKAMLLFSINLIGISFAAIIVFYLVKLHPLSQKEEEGVKQRFFGQLAVTIILLVLIIVPLSLFTIQAVQNNAVKQKLKEIVEMDIDTNQVYDSLYKIADGEKNVRLILYPGRKYETEKIETHMNAELDNVKLEIYYLN